MLILDHIAKTYVSKNNQTLQALDDISCTIQSGEIVTIFGPNGSGKSSLLNIIAGLDKDYTGSVLLDTSSVENKNVGFVFQNYNESMFPWLSVFDNVVFPLQIQKKSQEECEKRAEHILKKVRLWEHRHKYLYELSGGMRQLASIARAFIGSPDLLLLDEPCSALDYSTTKHIELELLSLWSEQKITTLVVSHDVDEAIFLADRVIVLTPRPSKISAIIEVNLPRPRNLNMFTDPNFFDIRSQVLHAFMYE